MQGRRKAKSKKSTRTFCVDGSSLPSLASFSAGFCKTGAAGLAPIQGKEGAKVVVGEGQNEEKASTRCFEPQQQRGWGPHTTQTGDDDFLFKKNEANLEVVRAGTVVAAGVEEADEAAVHPAPQEEEGDAALRVCVCVCVCVKMCV